ncbi:bifunctional Armadillo-like helical/Armadillo-type fold/Translational activator Gcn1 [Babesia duncani]|uniref:Bifunctional Armadillo-like helical/Armadillo-type fold/Translational activator Gcn1 n=1 Tax=Babesia duncani TaxID=323732 RepID=A0AAD9PNM4_9APIC|nr:bifunctional Armadillo-like helical/Armadillo-type fold/Translational activator Gcn1 [Babesia duncani]
MPPALPSDGEISLPIKRLSLGIISPSDLKEIGCYLRNLKIKRGNSGKEVDIACIGSLVAALDKAVYDFSNISLSSKYRNRLLKIANSIKKLIKVSGKVDTLSTEEHVGIPFCLFYCNSLSPHDHRTKQLELLKSLIVDGNPHASPLSILTFDSLLKTITLEEFNDHIYQHLLRVLKRNNKFALWHCYVIFEYLDATILATHVSEFVDSLQDFLTSNNNTIGILKNVEIDNDGEIYNRSAYAVAQRAIQKLSKTFSVTTNDAAYVKLSDLLEWFKNHSTAGIAEQEKYINTIIWLLPDHLSDCDRKRVSEIIKNHYEIIYKNATSNVFDTVKFKFVVLIGVFIEISIDPSGLNDMLISTILNETRCTATGAKIQHAKLDKEFLYHLLTSLRKGGKVECPKLYKALVSIVEYTVDRPAYRNCCFAALCLIYMYPLGNELNASITTASKGSTPSSIDIESILLNTPPWSEDLLSHLELCINFIRASSFNKDTYIKVTGPGGMQNLFELIIGRQPNNPFYSTAASIIESLYKRQDKLFDSLSGRHYSKDQFDRLLKDFHTVLKEADYGHLLGFILTLSERENALQSTSRFHRFLVYFMRDLNLSCKNPLNVAFIAVITGMPRGYINLNMPLRDIARMLLVKQSNFKIMERMGITAVQVDLQELALYSRIRIENGYNADVSDYVCGSKFQCEALVFDMIKILDSCISELGKYDNEDFQIFLAPPDSLYPDPRPFQPFLNKSLTDVEKKKLANVTKQQLDEMRLEMQGNIRQEISKLISKYIGAKTVLTRLFSCRPGTIIGFTGDILSIIKRSIRFQCLRGMVLLSLKTFCINLIPKCIVPCNHLISSVLDVVYEGSSDYNEALMVAEDVLKSIQKTSEFPPPVSAILMDIISWIILVTESPLETKRLGLLVLIEQLKSRAIIDPDQLLILVKRSSTMIELDDLTTRVLDEAASYLMNQEHLPLICDLGMTTRVKLVKEALGIYHRVAGPSACNNIHHILRVFGVVDGSEFDIEKVIELVPKYCHENDCLSGLVATCLAACPNITQILEPMYACFESLDAENVNAMTSVLNVLGIYINKSFKAYSDSLVFFKSLQLFAKPYTPIPPLFECSIALADNVKEMHLAFLMECKHVLSHDVLKSDSAREHTDEIGSLVNVKLACGLITMGYVTEKLQEYDQIVQWAIRLLLKLAISPVNIFAKDTNYHLSTVLTKLTRKCVLQGTSEHAFISKQIEILFEKSLENGAIAKPLVSLLRGVGLAGLKDHNITSILKGHLIQRTNSQAKINSMKIIEELCLQFGKMLESFSAELLESLISAFDDECPLVESASLSIINYTTPVGLKPILPVILNGIGNYSWRIKLKSLNLLGELISKKSLQLLLIKNISKIINEVSKCSTDESVHVKTAANRVLDKVTNMVASTCITFKAAKPILGALTLPNDERLEAMIRSLNEIQSVDQDNNVSITLIELGLVQPSLCRLFKSRNGNIREQSVIVAGWLASKCLGILELDMFCQSILPSLIPLLRDPLPTIRHESSKSIGICAKAFKVVANDASELMPQIEHLVNVLLDSMKTCTTSMERCSAARGLAEALQAVDELYANTIVQNVLDLIVKVSNNPQMREGGLALFTFLPTTWPTLVQVNLKAILDTVTLVLNDEDARVREMGCNVLSALIDACSSQTAFSTVLLDHLLTTIQSDDWQIRNATLIMMEQLNHKCGGSLHLQAEMFLSRSDDNNTVRDTALAIWKGINVTRVIPSILPIVLNRILQLLRRDVNHQKYASRCISEIIERLGKESADLFLKHMIDGEGANEVDVISRCVGITAVFSAVNNSLVLQDHIPQIVQFLKEALCVNETRDHASQTLAAVAVLFPDVVTAMVIPSILENLEKGENYMLGIECLLESNTDCFDFITDAALSAGFSATNLKLLEKVICANRGGMIISQLARLDSCIDRLLFYSRTSFDQFAKCIDNIVPILKDDIVDRMITILMKRLNEYKSARIAKNASENITNCNNLLHIINVFLQKHDGVLDSAFDQVTSSLCLFIFADSETLRGGSLVYDTLIKITEKRGQLEPFITLIEGFLSRDIKLVNLHDGTILNHTMLLIQKVLMRSTPTAKALAINCICYVCKLLDTKKIGPFVLKLIGVLIRTLNDKSTLVLKEAALKAISALLICDIVHIKAILSQLQSTLLKCLNDVNSSVTQLVVPNIRLLVSLAPTRCDQLLNEMLSILEKSSATPNSRTSAIECICGILSVEGIIVTYSPIDALLAHTRTHTGNDRSMLCRCIGLATNHFKDSWPRDWILSVYEVDVTMLNVLCEICGIGNFNLLEIAKLSPCLEEALTSETPSLILAGIELYSVITKLSKNDSIARDFVIDHFSTLPTPMTRSTMEQTRLLKIYRQVIRHVHVIGFNNTMMPILKTIADATVSLLYSMVPLVKLEAEKVLLALLNKRHDTMVLKEMLKAKIITESTCKTLTEYSERVLIKSNRIDVPSDID